MVPGGAANISGFMGRGKLQIQHLDIPVESMVPGMISESVFCKLRAHCSLDKPLRLLHSVRLDQIGEGPYLEGNSAPPESNDKSNNSYRYQHERASD